MKTFPSPIRMAVPRFSYGLKKSGSSHASFSKPSRREDLVIAGRQAFDFRKRPSASGGSRLVHVGVRYRRAVGVSGISVTEHSGRRLFAIVFNAPCKRAGVFRKNDLQEFVRLAGKMETCIQHIEAAELRRFHINTLQLIRNVESRHDRRAQHRQHVHTRIIRADIGN